MNKKIDDLTTEDLVNMTTDDYLRTLFSSGHPFLIATGAVLLGYVKYKVAADALGGANPQLQPFVDKILEVSENMNDITPLTYIQESDKLDEMFKDKEEGKPEITGFDLDKWNPTGGKQ